MTRDERMDEAVQVLSKREPYFAATYRAARALLNSAVFGAGLVRFPNGTTATSEACSSCPPNTVCLHRVGARIYCHGE